MAKITFDEISIENFGPFRERQLINLAVLPARPVVLVKALNGSGKTTLLTALQVGLYGHKGANLARRSEYEHLISSLQRGDAHGNSVIEVKLSVDMAGDHRAVTLRREWTKRGTALVESLSILSNGLDDPEFADGWDEFINTILPAELVHLFLFDGEKIEALANPERLPDLLRRATEVFLGLGGIDALETDLRAVERRANTRKKEGSSELLNLRAEAERYEQERDGVHAKIIALTQKQAELNNTVDRAKIDLERYQLRASKSGLTAFEQAAKLKSEAESATKQYKDSRMALTAAMSDPFAPMAWLGEIWKEYKIHWDKEQLSRNAELLSSEFKKRDQRLLKSLKLPPKIYDLLKQTFRDDLADLRLPTRRATIFENGGNPHDVDERINDALRLLLQHAKGSEKASKVVAKAEQAVGTIPAKEQLAQVFALLQQHSQSLANAQNRLHDCMHELAEMRTYLLQIESRVNTAKEKLRTEFKDEAQELHGLQAAGRAKQVLTQFRERLMSSKAQWLSEMITAEFRKLLRKKHMISRVVIDPQTYAVSIEGSGQHLLPMERLSAGERQILAISVLSALIRERKGRFPVVVDTPLARLDNKHRNSLIDNFFSKISHQVLILSTDEEVHGDVYQALRPFIGTQHRLEYSEDEHRTTVINEQEPTHAD
ncbi:DNA sulfur modification protein DndD [Pseudoduganella sp. FT25W]|uniref:DNA sulfur modification protein DndD n=1 Tax=Duganella alba TaxID=2666081 RepID=A0A6L5QF37_9BURK|nr:DNA sulfur modification protein DndD [Duganella alba]MRX08138.1 DNA sulfur modification protein DndD [Duganella alba]MRX16325.1 DNA sulfur modification protein DndD [Duganella alba]